MDLRKFVTCLSDSELEELEGIIHREKIIRFDFNQFPPLNEEEKKLLTTFGKVRTILAYRVRTRQHLYICKMMVDFADTNVSA